MTNKITTVVNIYKDEYDVYIGRVGKGASGYFGNPIKFGETCVICGSFHERAGETLDCYSIYFKARINEDSDFKGRVSSLRGKRLGCFCKPKRCHGDIIADYLNNPLETNKQLILV